MAYNRGNRFPPPPKCNMLLDPGAYEVRTSQKLIPNKAPFLSRAPRKTSPCGPLWSQAIYDTGLYYRIVPNCTSLLSKCPRFPYEAFSKEDLEALLCRCGIRDECECKPGDEEEKEEVICQGKVPKRIIIGPTPRTNTDQALSVPSKNDHGFDLLPDGSQKRLLHEIKNASPPFYNSTVHYSTEYYHGWKWSKWIGRSTKYIESSPGPADFCYVKVPSDYEICMEHFREDRRMNSKQLRFIEMVQARNILEGRPGPATYSPEDPKGHEMQYFGPKAHRFKKPKFEQYPGPADHDVKRTFDLPKPPSVPCHAKLPEPSFFGVKAKRFKIQREEGPSPASYNPEYKPCRIMRCSTAPFGLSAARFKENVVMYDDDEDEEIIADHEPEKEPENVKEPCPHPTWEFRSKTLRMKPLKRLLNEPSPADLPQSRNVIERSGRLQYLAPFLSSEGRFQPWKDWMPVLGGVKTPGPCYYQWNKPKCYPAVTCGPLQRSQRFPTIKNENPAPNHYKLKGGIESVLATHNEKLKDNIKNQHTFKWEPPIEPDELSYEEQENILLYKSIALLDIETEDGKKEEEIKTEEREDDNDDESKNRKYLRSFVYGQRTPHCI